MRLILLGAVYEVIRSTLTFDPERVGDGQLGGAGNGSAIAGVVVDDRPTFERDGLPIEGGGEDDGVGPGTPYSRSNLICNLLTVESLVPPPGIAPRYLLAQHSGK